MTKAQELSLDEAQIRETLRVVGVCAPTAAPDWTRLLEEIGFLPGERVELLVRARPGGDPLVVRVGQSSFALRRSEAACIRVRRIAP